MRMNSILYVETLKKSLPNTRENDRIINQYFSIKPKDYHSF
jgi:hypothetical protein